MAEIDFDTFDDGAAGYPQPRGQRAQRLVHLSGAAMSVALLVGAVWWGYQLAVRDVTGVPVMRAIEGAMRIAPADPGGDVAGHQGLSVNAVAAAGTAAPLPESLTLAPAPEMLSDEDAAGLMQPILAGVALEGQGSTLFEENGGQPAAAPLAAAEIPTSDQDAVAAALAEALGTADTVAAPASDAGGAQVLASVRPAARPATLSAAATLEPTLASASASAPAEVDAASVALGTSLVQLGAFDDGGAARTDWSRLAGRFPELMEGKSMLIQTAESGGRTFYRLRAVGFADADEARRFCTALLAENASCVPVTQR